MMIIIFIYSLVKMSVDYILLNPSLSGDCKYSEARDSQGAQKHKDKKDILLLHLWTIEV